MGPPACPDCTSQRLSLLGKIPGTNFFAGRVLPQPLDGGSLWRCDACTLAFRWPVLAKSSLDALYASGNEKSWGKGIEKREDWLIARRWLDELFPQGASVLDVGCFDGGFLGSLGERYRLCGVEIHPGARERAREKGIEILGDDFSSLPDGAETVDCVTAFDVIEHVHSPAAFLERCKELIRPGGWLIISTGNFDHPAFKLMASSYWYCVIPEHISFISPRWMNAAALRLGLQRDRSAVFSHGDRTILRRYGELLKNALYRVSPQAFAFLRRSGLGRKDVRKHPELEGHPPNWMTANDHFVMLLQRP